MHFVTNFIALITDYGVSLKYQQSSKMKKLLVILFLIKAKKSDVVRVTRPTQQKFPLIADPTVFFCLDFEKFMIIYTLFSPSP